MRKRVEATQPKLPAQSDAGVQMVQTEAQLSSLAYRLIGQNDLTRAEQHHVARLPDVPIALVETVRTAIKAGDDPLGEYFCRLRGPELRRKNGATYTPPAIVTAMISWAVRQPNAPVRVVDPGSGSGRFLIAAAKAFPAAALVAAETDPLALLLLRANANVNGFSDRLKVHCRDYRSLTLPPVNGPTLFIGNPPYVRHHDISELWKDWFAKTAVTYGLRASKLAGLHIHFFLKTRTLGGPGDYGAFITSAEWIDVNYGSILREMLADGLGGTSLHVIDPAARPFADALTTGAITCFNFGAEVEHFTVGTAGSLEALGDLK